MSKLRLNALERVFLAVTHLCDGSGGIHTRLEQAVMFDLLPLNGGPYEWKFPPKLARELADIIQQCTGHGNIPESISKMSTDDARAIARRILALSVRVRAFEDPEHELLRDD